MTLDSGPLVALVAGGTVGALMQWAGPRLRAWRERHPAPAVVRQALLLGGVAAALALAVWSSLAEPELPWLEDMMAWAGQDAGSPFAACPAGDGADRPAVAMVRLLSASGACPPAAP